MHSLFKGVIRGYLLAFVVERRNFNIHGTFALHKNIFKSVKNLSNVIVPKGGFSQWHHRRNILDCPKNLSNEQFLICFIIFFRILKLKEPFSTKKKIVECKDSVDVHYFLASIYKK